jgi:hypothetical protein
MPCDTKLRDGETKDQRSARAQAATERLEAKLKSGSAKVKVGANGAIAFAGWTDEDRDGVADVCAYRRMTAKGSGVLRMAIARAETLAGRKVNPQAIAAGVHSHDGGTTWAKH